MRYISLFSGVEAATLAWEPLGWEPVAFAEIEPFPSAVLTERWPDVPNLGDVTQVDWSKYKGKVDLVVGGSPCFVAGTLVLCEDGFKPIEEVQVGERVVTHRGNLKHVLATGSKVADTIMLKGQGSVGIECTPNHPFFSRTKRKVWNNDKREYKMVVESDAAWTDAKDMQGKFWLNVCNVNATDIPPLGKYGKGKRSSGYIEKFEFTSDFFYFVGRWLGDGWANEHARKGRIKSLMKRVYVCCSHDEGDELEEKLNSTGLHFGRVNNGSTERFTCSSTQLFDWLVGNFGVHADGKNIPAWCLGMPESFRKAMLDGYLDADGSIHSGGYRSTTINRKLALGIKALAGSCGLTTGVTYAENNRDAVIEGRHVNERPTYISTHYKKPRSAFFADGGYYGLVRSVSECSSSVIVYNLEVEDDNSYTADGIAVHNCQAFSVAGKREGLLDERGQLMLEYVRAVREVEPRWFLWENVPGVLSQDKGRAFGTLLGEMADLGYSCAWRVLDAQFFGVAQRRRRVFLVGCLGGGAGAAAAVLFEPESVSGNTQTSKQKREALAAHARSGPAGAGGGVTAFAQNTRDEVRVQGDGTISGALSAQPGMKQQTYVAEARAYRTIPLECPICGSDAVVEVDDPQEPEMFWRYMCGCSDMGCENYYLPRRSFASREDAIADWNGSVLLNSYSIDYKQTPKTNENVCHTLTREGEGGIHSAVAYAEQSGCLTPWDVQSKRIFPEGGCAPTLQSGTHEHNQHVAEPLVLASAHYNAEIGEGGVAPTLIAHIQKDAPVLAMGRTCSQPSAPQTGASSSSTTNPSTAEGSCSTQDGSGPDAICMADDTARAAVDENLSGSLKVGGVRRSLRFV